MSIILAVRTDGRILEGIVQSLSLHRWLRWSLVLFARFRTLYRWVALGQPRR